MSSFSSHQARCFKLTLNRAMGLIKLSKFDKHSFIVSNMEVPSNKMKVCKIKIENEILRLLQRNKSFFLFISILQFKIPNDLSK